MKKRNYETDLMKIISSFMVVLLHTAAMGPVLTTEKGFIINTFFNCITRFCVPVFVMISGFYMLEREENISYYIKRALKYFLVMLLWSIVYLLKYTFTDLVEIKNIKEAVYFLLTQPGHLWYFYAIAALTLFTPLMSFFSRNADKKTYLYTMTLMFIMGCVITPLIKDNSQSLLGQITEKTKIGSIMAFPFYYMFGYYVRRFGTDKKISVFSLFTGLLLTLIITEIYSFKEGTLYLNSLSFFAFNTALFAMGFFSFFSSLKIRENIFLKLIAPLTGGIYGFHIIVVPSVYYRINGFVPSFLAVPVGAVISFVISAAAVWIWKKLKCVFKKELK